VNPLRTVMLTALALLGFAGNSVLCRLALASGSIDAATFTATRLGCGVAMLTLLVTLRGSGARVGLGAGSWASALALFGYATLFSFAYLRLHTGVGALVLFTCVQLTMLSAALLRGERLASRQWVGLALAAGGLIGLTAPGFATAPDVVGTLSMALAGVAWGAYSLRGKGARDPLAVTTGNFTRALPLALLLLAATHGDHHATPRGLALAAASGALASGVAYSVWYAALPRLSATRAAVVQLAVPVLAAAAGIALLGEPATSRLLLAGAAIVLGIVCVVL
jgi:drug/metabolite transporter (DMT)-like permease